MLQDKLETIMPGGRSMILAYDQGLEHGPRDFTSNPDSRRLEYILDIAVRGKFTGLVLHAGLAEKYHREIMDSEVPLILKLNGKSELFTDDDPFSPQLYTVDDAITLGASAVGYTVYTGSSYEHEMNRQFADIVREAHYNDIPVIGWMYPRGRAITEKTSASKAMELAVKEQKESGMAIDETPAIVSYAARVGMELGADIVKVKNTGSVEGFRRVVESAAPTRVVMSGGTMTHTDDEFLDTVRQVLDAGAIGVAVGRNIWQRQDPFTLAQKLYKLILGS